MNAVIIAIGSELISGEKLDTNSQWLTLSLAEAGISVRRHFTVDDDLPAMIEVLRSAGERAEWVFLTGGLGPTLDDITRFALAELAGQLLVLHEPSLEHIRSLFESRGRRMPKRNRTQAMIPAGSEPIANQRGTAPGIWMEWPRPHQNISAIFVALPGVPSEMKEMFHREVLPRLPRGNQFIRRARVNCFGMGESAFEERLGELTARGGDPEVGITAHEATITLRITARAGSDADCRQKIAVAKRTIRQRLSSFVFGEEDEELEHVVVRMLRENRLTMAVSESGTGGLLAHRLTDVDGFEETFLGGMIVPHPHLSFGRDEQGGSIDPYSAQWALRMAAESRDQFQTDLALAVTSWPRSGDASETPPRGHIALIGDGVEKTVEHILVGDPAIAKSRAAKTALNLLRLHLLND